MFIGDGEINIHDTVQLGYFPSPFFYGNNNHIEARYSSASISINENTMINNSATLISEGEGISIGRNCLIGPNVEIYDTDFHEIDTKKRHTHLSTTKKVVIKDNVFIGSGVKILKGVTIEENCVIGAGSIVTKSCPPNVIVAGNPARIIKEIK